MEIHSQEYSSEIWWWGKPLRASLGKYWDIWIDGHIECSQMVGHSPYTSLTISRVWCGIPSPLYCPWITSTWNAFIISQPWSMFKCTWLNTQSHTEYFCHNLIGCPTVLSSSTPIFEPGSASCGPKDLHQLLLCCCNKTIWQKQLKGELFLSTHDSRSNRAYHSWEHMAATRMGRHGDRGERLAGHTALRKQRTGSRTRLSILNFCHQGSLSSLKALHPQVFTCLPNSTTRWEPRVQTLSLWGTFHIQTTPWHMPRTLWEMLLDTEDFSRILV